MPHTQVVLNTDKARAATPEILAVHCISQDRSPDLAKHAAVVNGDGVMASGEGPVGFSGGPDGVDTELGASQKGDDARSVQVEAADKRKEAKTKRGRQAKG
jgi:hypothetical protein